MDVNTLSLLLFIGLVVIPSGVIGAFLLGHRIGSGEGFKKGKDAGLEFSGYVDPPKQYKAVIPNQKKDASGFI